MKKKKLFDCVVSVRLDQADKEKLDKVCSKSDLSKSEYLRDKVKNIIEGMDKKKINVPDFSDLELCKAIDLFPEAKVTNLSDFELLSTIDLFPDANLSDLDWIFDKP
jgi:hypothetical protein